MSDPFVSTLYSVPDSLSPGMEPTVHLTEGGTMVVHLVRGDDLSIVGTPSVLRVVLREALMAVVEASLRPVEAVQS
jgi:hypothetical protein